MRLLVISAWPDLQPFQHMVPALSLASLSAVLRLNEGDPRCQFNRFKEQEIGESKPKTWGWDGLANECPATQLIAGRFVVEGFKS
jgi:hypothetical protein